MRRWQYPDGRFTEEGKERYFGNVNSKEGDETVMRLSKAVDDINKNIKSNNNDYSTHLSKNPYNLSTATRKDFSKRYGYKISNKQMDNLEYFMNKGLGDNATKKQIRQAREILKKYNIYDADITWLKDHDIFAGDD